MDIVKIGLAMEEYGLVSVVLAAIIYLIVHLITVLVKHLIENRATKKEKKKIYSIQELKKTHPILVKIDSIINNRLPLIYLGGEVRTKIFRDMLKILFENFKKEIEKSLEDDINEDSFLYKNKVLMDNVISYSMKDWQIEGIPPVVISKFLEWISKRCEFLQVSISDIDSSKIVDTAVEKEYMALNVYMSVIYLTYIDAEKTLTRLNGSLTGLEYKGEKIESLH